MLIGSHLSIAGGHVNALKTANHLNLDAVALFTASPRIWKRPDPETVDLEAFHEFRKNNNKAHMVAHALYLANPATPSKQLRQKSIAAISTELKLCHMLQIPWMVIHPGSHQGKGEKWAVRKVASVLDQCLENSGTTSTGIALETTSGGGNSLGGRFEHLRDIIGASKYPDRYSICVDSCHIFAAGYDLRSPETWQATRQQLQDIIGLQNIRVWHFNDSLGDFGSCKDRHAHIGKGNIGMDGFSLLINDPVCQSVPLILETPKDPAHSWDQENVETLRNLVKDRLDGSKATKSQP